MKKFSPSTCGFYDTDIHKNIPEDAIEVSDAESRFLREDGQSKGQEIAVGENGKLVLKSPVEDSELKIKKQILRLEAEIKPRRIREAILGIDDGWLSEMEDQIALLRGQIGK